MFVVNPQNILKKTKKEIMLCFFIDVRVSKEKGTNI